MTYRDNEVRFYLEGQNSLIGGSYSVDSYSVTEGQDPDGHIHAGLHKTFGSDGKMNFSVGRKGSESVANWFNNRIPASQTTFNHEAGKLNFAFLGTLKLTLSGGMLGKGQETFTFPNIGIAQSHTGGRNNWWFGGQNCFYVQNNQVIAQGMDAKGDPVSFVFWRGGNGVNEIGITSLTLIDTMNWMEKLSDSTRLDHIMMPGSHDAGMSELHHCAPPKLGDGYVQTQSGSIGQQLVDGARYFDIRVDYDYDQLVTYHRTDGWGCNGQSLSSVLEQTREFLNAHPTETVFLKFSHIRSYEDHDPNVTKQKINALLNNYEACMYKNVNTNINLAENKLGNVRGKMIMVFDYNEYIDPAKGRFRYKNANLPQPNLAVYDNYSNTNDYNKMWHNQVDKWNNYGGWGRGYFFCLSWTLTPNTLGATIVELAAKANANLPDVLYDQIVEKRTGKPNIVYLDYINDETTQSIILYNFNYSFHFNKTPKASMHNEN